MDIDRLILSVEVIGAAPRFGSLMDIDRLIRMKSNTFSDQRFGSLMDIDRLIHNSNFPHRKVL